ncbi:twin-arginine translocation signal domain-containing protein, partial [Acetobacter oeni]
MTLSRRNFLRNATVLAGIAGLAACTATTTNGVTTITLNVTKVKDYGQAGL